ncbi:RICIN domain-containing protein [Niabella pedocola]|uniref:RICIN domain-containing protein n=1 Tax=Niabella pedocola TaxID=1752077 RepID=A0ABS8PW18_9BACT|nr:RICIN domain-containing protein [Niabella pedocola]MCD2425110.1 RICIN domain-containing protein [Niabella pedocola]
MKKKIELKNFWKIGKSVVLFSAILASCSKDVREPSDAGQQVKPRGVTSGPAIVSAHRVNDLLKLDEVKNSGIKSLEVDIFVGMKNGQPTCLIGHEAATATGQTLAEYFAYLNQKIPDFESVWLDCKDLNSSANETLFTNTLNSLNTLYSIKNRVLVESRYIPYLVSFKQNGWKVSYYCNWEDVYGQSSAQQQIVMGQMYSELTTYGIDGISYDAAINTPMKNYFSSKTVGGQPVKMYSWDISRYYGEPNLSTKIAGYDNLGILLISFDPPQATIVDGANYRIVSELTDEPSMLVDVNATYPVNGTNVTLWTYNYPTSNNQVWKLRSLGSGYYAFKTLADTTKVLHVTGGGSANSTPVVVSAFNNSNAQKWKINYVGGGYYNLTPACATGKNLDVDGGDASNGTQIQIYTAHTYGSQKFRLVKQ